MAKKKYYDKMNYGPGVSNDTSKHANLPTEVIMKDYPKLGYVMQSYGDNNAETDRVFDKTIRMINDQRTSYRFSK